MMKMVILTMGILLSTVVWADHHRTPPLGATQCCVPDDDGEEVHCKLILPSSCATRGGTDLGIGTCSPNPCPQPPEVACCSVENQDEGDDEEGDGGEVQVPECKLQTEAECLDEGGVSQGAGSVCDPNPCVTTTTTVSVATSTTL